MRLACAELHRRWYDAPPAGQAALLKWCTFGSSSGVLFYCIASADSEQRKIEMDEMLQPHPTGGAKRKEWSFARKPLSTRFDHIL